METNHQHQSQIKKIKTISNDQIRKKKLIDQIIKISRDLK
jgi:hypothetical protein